MAEPKQHVKPVHQLTVFQQTDGTQWVQAVLESQECGIIKGGGTCQQPLRIELKPAYAAGPAFALAWDLVPVDIQERIYDALHKPDTEWVEKSIREATGNDV